MENLSADQHISLLSIRECVHTGMKNNQNFGSEANARTASLKFNLSLSQNSLGGVGGLDGTNMLPIAMIEL